ncbi:hypothetical protein [Prosthecobacter sp.]|uniref:hypothetical protein n=1 Tax=Prosthecobacter sp. TaxID=1965333 RepID=UPI002AB9C716|nr:hypothetical protein [Prosthecobacter sp.]MDZ4402651.1 hypothetical protein [Prosthecobacter sp.]
MTALTHCRLATHLLISWVATVLSFVWQASASAESVAEPVKGQRVFTAGHSLLMYMPPVLAEVAAAAKAEGHVQAGIQSIGGSQVIRHWDLSGAKNTVKPALRRAAVDVLMLSPIYLPDEGIEKLVMLGAQHNPDIRVLVQEFWIPYDDPTVLKAGAGPKIVDRDSRTLDELRTMHAAYFQSMDDHASALNAKLGKRTVFIVPVGQAVMALRGKIIAHEAPGLTKQSALFTDGLGHAGPVVKVLATYCHFAVIYRRSPIGLPVPTMLASQLEAEKLNRLLQELAWEAVTAHPLSGMKNN